MSQNKRPEKMIGSGNSSENPFGFGRVTGHNQACDEWEKWILKELKKIRPLDEPNQFNTLYTVQVMIDSLVKEIKQSQKD